MSDQGMFNFDGEYADEQRSRVIPWVIIGAISIVAILISLLVINMFRGAGDSGDNGATSPPSPSTSEPAGTTEPTSPTTAPTTPPTQPTSPPSSGKPDDEIDTSGVVVGSTYDVDVPYEGWDVTISVPNKLSTWTYELAGENNRLLLLNSDLIDKLPASCNHLKTQWGIERVGDGEFTPYTPQQMCEENEALYVELLGLVKAIGVSPLEED